MNGALRRDLGRSTDAFEDAPSFLAHATRPFEHPTRIRSDPTRIRWRPTRVRSRPTTIQSKPTRMREHPRSKFVAPTRSLARRPSAFTQASFEFTRRLRALRNPTRNSWSADPRAPKAALGLRTASLEARSSSVLVHRPASEAANDEERIRTASANVPGADPRIPKSPLQARRADP